MFASAIHFADTVTLGAAILGLAAALATIVGILYGVRYKVAYEAEAAAARALRESLGDERARSERAETQSLALRNDLTKASERITKLEQLPDFAALVRLLDRHEQRAQERHESTTEVLSEIARSLSASDGRR